MQTCFKHSKTKLNNVTLIAYAEIDKHVFKQPAHISFAEKRLKKKTSTDFSENIQKKKNYV